jgi:hypothetical protein
MGKKSCVTTSFGRHRPTKATSPTSSGQACSSCRQLRLPGPLRPPMHRWAAPAIMICRRDQNELLLVQGRANRHGVDQDEVHLQQQVSNGMGRMMVSTNRSGSCDHLLLQPSPSYPQPEPMQHVKSDPPPQLLGAAGIAEIGECDAVAPHLEMDEHGLDTAMMDAHRHAPTLKRRFVVSISFQHTLSIPFYSWHTGLFLN